MGKNKDPKKPNLELPSPEKDKLDKIRAAEAERKRREMQRGRAATVMADPKSFGTAATASLGLGTSLG